MTTGAVWARDDFQYWSQVSIKPIKTEKYDFLVFTEQWFKNDAEKLGFYYISPRFIYHYSKKLDLGLNYTYVQTRSVLPSAVDDSYNTQQRIELEFNPNWKPTSWSKLTMRNRVEFRWFEDRGWNHTRYRQRWTFDVPVKNIRFVKSVYANTENLYDFPEGKVLENRTAPIGVNFKINDKFGFSVYYQIQSQKGTKDWSSNQIFGTLMSIDF